MPVLCSQTIQTKDFRQSYCTFWHDALLCVKHFCFWFSFCKPLVLNESQNCSRADELMILLQGPKKCQIKHTFKAQCTHQSHSDKWLIDYTLFLYTYIFSTFQIRCCSQILIAWILCLIDKHYTLQQGMVRDYDGNKRKSDLRIQEKVVDKNAEYVTRAWN